MKHFVILWSVFIILFILGLKWAHSCVFIINYLHMFITLFDIFSCFRCPRNRRDYDHAVVEVDCAYVDNFKFICHLITVSD